LSKSNLKKFELRLGLAAYFLDLLGCANPTTSAGAREFLTSLADAEGYEGEASRMAHALISKRACKLAPAKIYAYDQNIRDHLKAMNRPIEFKYFQMLAAFCSEVYLDRVSADSSDFLRQLNQFIDNANEEKSGYYQFEKFTRNDLNKLAFWMATGSGKTLVMHLNYYQWLHYRPAAVDNILLITPNEGLTRQHLGELRKSGIPCAHFNHPQPTDPDAVRLLEIHKLTDKASGEGTSVEVDAFEGQNLIFVDEGHKGATGNSWMNYRRRLSQDGFAFEYSATFGQAIAGTSTEVQHEYGKAIALNYSYPRFYDDGYGKDYHILNLSKEVNHQFRDRYLLANLLAFTEQCLVFESDPETLSGEYNIAEPLLMFVGSSVTAGRTRGSLTTNETRSLSDVQMLVLFLARVLKNEQNWAVAALDRILESRSGIERKDSSDLFENLFPYLREHYEDGEHLYKDLLRNVFHVRSSGGRLQIVDIESTSGEVALRAGGTDQYFGVIDIGNKRVFLDLAIEKLPEVDVDSDSISESLFHSINSSDSDIRLLLGSRKFIEGWSSWRVSSMGLMNFGQSPGPLIIQLFGRGVRLLGKNRSLKRTRALANELPPKAVREKLEVLETLNVFGVRAKYMAEFRKYLAEEGIDVDEWVPLKTPVPTRIREEFLAKGLVSPRTVADSSENFRKQVCLELKADAAYRPTINLAPRVEALSSQGAEVDDEFLTSRGQRLPKVALSLIDWNSVLASVAAEQRAKGRTNLILSDTELRTVVEGSEDSWFYTLFCPDSLLEVRTMKDVKRIERIAFIVLSKYVDQFYDTRKKIWEDEKREYVPLTTDDSNILDAYGAGFRGRRPQSLIAEKENPDG